jgi:hypothetical protein
MFASRQRQTQTQSDVLLYHGFMVRYLRDKWGRSNKARETSDDNCLPLIMGVTSQSYLKYLICSAFCIFLFDFLNNPVKHYSHSMATGNE